MYNDIHFIDGGEEMYRLTHGIYTASLDDLTNYTGPSLAYKIELQTSDLHWFVAVPAQNRFPGNYLFKCDPREMKIFFHTDRPATTNDLVLVTGF
jgi:hypothetical protein